MLNIALIGVTGFGEAHYQALRQLEGEGQLRLAAVTIINPQEAAAALVELKQAGCRIYDDYREMLREEAGKCDLVSVPTGIAWHCRMTCDALDHGFHVVVEKPVAGTVAEVDQMIAARDRAQRRVFVGFHDFYMPPLLTMKQRVVEGVIGAMQTISVQACWPRSVSYYERNNWAGRLQCGDQYVYDSPANNALAHYLMASLYLAAREQHAVAAVIAGQGELYRAKPIESFDTMAVRLQTDSGVELRFTLTHSAATPQGPVVVAQAEHGRIVWRFNQQFTLEPTGESLPTPAGHGCQVKMFRGLAAALASDTPFGCTLEMAREHTRMINALHDHCPIHTVAPEHCQHYPDQQLIAVNGIENAVTQSFETGKLFSELGCPWASPATAFQLR